MEDNAFDLTNLVKHDTSSLTSVLAHLLASIGKLNLAVKDLTLDRDAARSAMAALQKQQETDRVEWQQALQSLRDQLNSQSGGGPEKDAQLQALQQQVNQHQQSIGQLEGALQLSQQQTASLSTELQKHTELLVKQKVAQDGMELRIVQLENDKSAISISEWNRIKNSVDRLETQTEEMKALFDPLRTDMADLTDAVESSRRTMNDGLHRTASQLQTLQSLGTNHESRLGRSEGDSREAASLRQRVSAVEEGLIGLRGKHPTQPAATATSSDDLHKLKEDMERLRKLVQDLSSSMNSKRNSGKYQFAPPTSSGLPGTSTAAANSSVIPGVATATISNGPTPAVDDKSSSTTNHVSASHSSTIGAVSNGFDHVNDGQIDALVHRVDALEAMLRDLQFLRASRSVHSERAGVTFSDDTSVTRAPQGTSASSSRAPSAAPTRSTANPTMGVSMAPEVLEQEQSSGSGTYFNRDEPKYATEGYCDQRFNALSTRLDTVTSAMKKKVAGELKIFERDLQDYLNEKLDGLDDLKKMSKATASSVGRIHFRCLSCNSQVQTVPGAATDAFKEATQSLTRPAELLIDNSKPIALFGTDDKVYKGRYYGESILPRNLSTMKGVPASSGMPGVTVALPSPMNRPGTAMGTRSHHSKANGFTHSLTVPVPVTQQSQAQQHQNGSSMHPERPASPEPRRARPQSAWAQR